MRVNSVENIGGVWSSEGKIIVENFAKEAQFYNTIYQNNIDSPKMEGQDKGLNLRHII